VFDVVARVSSHQAVAINDVQKSYAGYGAGLLNNIHSDCNDVACDWQGM
jgi:hypothetical protein